MATAEPITHHRESKSVIRRGIFAAMPAVGALLAAPALTGEDTAHRPAARLFRKWRDAFAAVQTDIFPTRKCSDRSLPSTAATGKS